MKKALLLFLMFAVPALITAERQMQNNVSGVLTGVGGIPVVPANVCNSSTTNFTSWPAVVTFPACSAAGGLVIAELYCNTSCTQVAPSGWRVVDDQLYPSYVHGLILSKTLTSGDISTGSVTFTGSTPSIVSLAVFSGTSGPIREVTSLINISQTSGAVNTLSTSQAVPSSDVAVLFMGATAQTPVISRGTFLTSSTGGYDNGLMNWGALGSGTQSSNFTATSPSAGQTYSYSSIVSVEAAGASQPGFIQEVSRGTLTTYTDALVLAPVLAGDALVVACTSDNTVGLTISDTLGTSFSTLYFSYTPYPTDQIAFYVWANYSSAGGADTVTVSQSPAAGAGPELSCIVNEFAGITGIDGSATAYYNTTGTAGSSVPSPQTLGPVTTTTTTPAHQDLLYTAFADFFGPSQYGDTAAGFATGAWQPGGFGGVTLLTGYSYPVASGGATYSAPWINGSVAAPGGFQGALIAFKYVP